MEMKKAKSQCSVHRLEAIAVDMNPLEEEKNRYFCPKCSTSSTQKRNIMLVEDANNYLSDIKSAFKQKKQQQEKRNLEILKEVASQVMSLKDNYTQALDKINENIKRHLASFEEQQGSFDDQLKQLDLDSFLSTNNQFVKQESSFQQMQNIISQQLEQILDEQKIKQCLNTLTSFDFSIISLEPEEQNLTEEPPEKQRTPHLGLNCEEHGQEIILFDLAEQKAKQNRLACVQCISDKLGQYTDLIVVQKQWEDYENSKKQLINTQSGSQNKKVDVVQENMKDLLQKFSQIITSSLQQLTNKQISLKQQHQSEISKMENNWQTLPREEVLDIAETLSKLQNQQLLHQLIEQKFNKQDEEINEIVKQLLLSLRDAEQHCFRIIYNLINAKEGLNETKQELLNISQTESIQLVTKQNLLLQRDILNINYEKEKNILNKLYEEFHCYAIAFNPQQTIMVAGFCDNIKIFEFKRGNIKQIQVLDELDSGVNTLYFMKKSNEFISGFDNGSIQLWGISYCNWYCKQKLVNAHYNSINLIIMNRLEDLMISCSDDNSIKFWVKNNEKILIEEEINEVDYELQNDLNQLEQHGVWECFQDLEVHSDRVYCVSLNDSQNQLASCSQDKTIVISQVLFNKKWAKVQQINVETHGLRLCFIGDNIISFQPWIKNKMLVFKFDIEHKEFISFKQITLDTYSDDCTAGFQQMYNQDKQILLNKNGQSVFLMKRQHDDDFIVEQTLKFGTGDVSGAMTDDGQYLVTWDDKSKYFQVRRIEN